MKALQIFFKYTLILSLLISFSCKKDPPIPESTDPVMPPLTHQGLNTFGCYIDGELYVVNEDLSPGASLAPLTGNFNEGTGYFAMQGRRYLSETIREDIIIRCTMDSGEGTYDYDLFAGGINGYRNYGGERCDYQYEYISDPGKITIKYYDPAKNIIAGTFYINLVNEDCETGDTLMKITDGRFDFHY